MHPLEYMASLLSFLAFAVIITAMAFITAFRINWGYRSTIANQRKMLLESRTELREIKLRTHIYDDVGSPAPPSTEEQREAQRVRVPFTPDSGLSLGDVEENGEKMYRERFPSPVSVELDESEYVEIERTCRDKRDDFTMVSNEAYGNFFQIVRDQ